MPQAHTYAIFSALYAPHTGGVESFTQRLAHELVSLGNRVFIVTSQLDSSSSSHEVQPDGVEVYRLPCWSLLGGRLPISRRNKAYGKMLDDLACQGVDRVLVNVRFYRNSLEGVRFARRLDVPVIVLDHGSAHLTFGRKAVDWLVERYEHAVTKRMQRLEPDFAGISKASAAWLGHFGIETPFVVPNAIDVDEYRDLASQHSYRSEYGLPDDQKLIVFVGRLEPEKGALELANAMGILGSSYTCFMAGEGRLRASIDDLRYDNVILLGRIPADELSALLGEADVFCLPSRSEGFCTSLLESAAQGTVPVMPHVGGTDEVMGWNPVRFGVMLDDVEPQTIAQAIHVAACMKEAASEEIARYVSERCSWDNTIEALEEAFDVIQV